MACGPLFHLLCIPLAITGLLGYLILFCNPAVPQWWVANDLNKYDTHACTYSCLFWTRPPLHFQKLSLGETWHLTCICMWAHFLFKNQWSWQTVKVYQQIGTSLSIHKTFPPRTICNIRYSDYTDLVYYTYLHICLLYSKVWNKYIMYITNHTCCQ